MCAVFTNSHSLCFRYTIMSVCFHAIPLIPPIDRTEKLKRCDVRTVRPDAKMNTEYGTEHHQECAESASNPFDAALQ